MATHTSRPVMGCPMRAETAFGLRQCVSMVEGWLFSSNCCHLLGSRLFPCYGFMLEIALTEGLAKGVWGCVEQVKPALPMVWWLAWPPLPPPLCIAPCSNPSAVSPGWDVTPPYWGWGRGEPTAPSRWHRGQAGGSEAGMTSKALYLFTQLP